MSQNTNKQHREIKVVVRDFTQQGERDKVRDELIKSGYKVVVKNFTKEVCRPTLQMSDFPSPGKEVSFSRAPEA